MSRPLIIHATCETQGCRRVPKPGRRLCDCCRQRRTRALHPEEHQWRRLKAKAIDRGLDFTITKAEWSRFCRDTGYLDGVGNTGEALTVDRINSARGYHADNIRVLDRVSNNLRRYGIEPKSSLPEVPVVAGVSTYFDEEDDVPGNEPF